MEQVVADPLCMLNVEKDALGRRGILLTLLDTLNYFCVENERALGGTSEGYRVAREAVVARDVVVLRCLGGVAAEHDVVKKAAERKGVAATFIGQGWDEGTMMWIRGVGEKVRGEIAWACQRAEGRKKVRAGAKRQQKRHTEYPHY